MSRIRASHGGGRLAAGLISISCLAVGGCSRAGSTTTTNPIIITTTTTTTTTTPTSTLAPRAAVYRAGNVAVRVAFSGTPAVQADPPTLMALLPAHARVTSWSVGDVGALQVHSYELVMAMFPPGTTTGTIDAFLAGYAGKPNTVLYGRPGLQELSTIPFSSGDRYSGIMAFSVGRVLVMAVGYDDVRSNVRSWLDSLRLVSPTP